MPFKIKNKNDYAGLSITGKLRLAIGAIILLLIVTLSISVLEFRRMSTYVSNQIAQNITTINLSSSLGVIAEEYNLNILSAVGKADEIVKSDIDTSSVVSRTREIFDGLSSQMSVSSKDLQNACEKYYDTSRQLDSIIVSDFVDTREWYFTVLQPEYENFRMEMEKFNVKVHDDLKNNSVSFDEGFYRGIIPVFVSVCAVILLCLLLQFFIVAYYVKPLRRMLKGMQAYQHSNINYVHVFEGDDELQTLNSEISELIEENQSLKQRLNNRES